MTIPVEGDPRIPMERAHDSKRLSESPERLEDNTKERFEYRWASQLAEDPRLAPRDVFEDILRHAVIPTIDLIVDCGPGVLVLKRRIPPYRNMWALPGLRMLKGDDIQETISRIARQELGLGDRQMSSPIFVCQQSIQFQTEMQRQDLSSCYAVETRLTSFVLNADHFSSVRLVRSVVELPRSLGRLYAPPLQKWFASKAGNGRRGG